jgi:hypothetical protein
MKRILLSIAFLTMIFGATLLTSCTKDDTTAPVISLTTPTTMYLDLGDTYTDPGYTATDDVDGDITTNVVTSGTVNTAQVGEYVITYTVSDAAGNTDSQERTVYVRADKLAGTYTVNSVITGGPGAGTYIFYPTVATTSTYNKLSIANFGGWGGTVLGFVTISGSTVTIYSQKPAGVPAGSEGTALGTGTYSGLAFTGLTYTWTYDTGGVDNCVETFTKN